MASENNASERSSSVLALQLPHQNQSRSENAAEDQSHAAGNGGRCPNCIVVVGGLCVKTSFHQATTLNYLLYIQMQ